jgi:DNA-binding NarL/FixJ family response regulator
MSDGISMAVVSNHSAFREGLILFLDGESGFHIVGNGRSNSDAIRIVEDEQPDVIILDANMPGGALEAARAIACIAPLTAVMILTVVDDFSVAAVVENVGAQSYVLECVSGPKLVCEIRRIWEATH